MNQPKFWHIVKFVLINVSWAFQYNISEIPTSNTFALLHWNFLCFTITGEEYVKKNLFMLWFLLQLHAFYPYLVSNFSCWFKLVNPCFVTSKNLCNFFLLLYISILLLFVLVPILFGHLSKNVVFIWQKSSVLSKYATYLPSLSIIIWFLRHLSCLHQSQSVRFCWISDGLCAS